MLKISSALQDIIENQPFLVFGLKKNLFNLTKLSRMLRPYVEARTKKQVKETAILMHLSRLQRMWMKNLSLPEMVPINNIVVHSNLRDVTFSSSRAAAEKVGKFYMELQKKNEFVVLTGQPSEITVVLSEENVGRLRKSVREKPKYERTRLSAISVRIGDQLMDGPGIFYLLAQQISLQGINIWDVLSTYTDIVFFIDQKDVVAAFDTFNALMRDWANSSRQEVF